MPGSPGLGLLVETLRRLGYTALFENSGANEANPWQAFDRAQRAAQNSQGVLAVLADLFLRRASVAHAAAEVALGSDLLSRLVHAGLLRAQDHLVHAANCILVLEDIHVATDYPVVTGHSQRWVSSGVYLSESSLELLRWTMKLFQGGRTLEIGCGLGLTSVALAKRGATAFGLDIDSSALRLAALNAEMNDVHVTLFSSDWLASVPEDAPFDLIACNPPWRLVPPNVAYPNPGTRVGRGRDGLDLVRAFLRDAPRSLSTEGCAFVRADLPCRDEASPDFLGEMPLLVDGDAFLVDVVKFGGISVTDQSLQSAETAHWLNTHLSEDQLTEEFAKMYRRLGYTDLIKCFIEIRRK